MYIHAVNPSVYRPERELKGFQKVYLKAGESREVTHRNIAWQIMWYAIAWGIITVVVNSINCVWVAVASVLFPGWLYNIGTTVLMGEISMLIFFFVFKIIFPEGENKK